MTIGTLIKQPNGKYCISDFDGKLKSYNLTEHDIINLYIEDAKAHIGSAEHYWNIIAKTVSIRTDQTNDISDDVLKEMGFDKPYRELIKLVPRKPLCKCPNCGSCVEAGMGHKDIKCRNCDQLLKW